MGANHGGTAYVWAPAVNVKFWETKEAFDNNDAAKLIKTLTTIRGNNLKLVGATLPEAPAAPAGKVFSHWVNADTGEVFDVNTSLSKSVTNVYPVYKVPTVKKVVKVHKKSPKTGDTENIPFYAGILAGTIIALGATLKLKRRA